MNVTAYNSGTGQNTQTPIQEKFNVVLVEVLVGIIKMCTESRKMQNIMNIKSKFHCTLAVFKNGSQPLHSTLNPQQLLSN
jgi:hypothetical protein